MGYNTVPCLGLQVKTSTATAAEKTGFGTAMLAEEAPDLEYR